MKSANQHVTDQIVSVEHAITALKAMTGPKFPPSVDVAIKLLIDPTKTDQNVKGSVIMPHGLGKTVKVVAFASNTVPTADLTITDEASAKEFMTGAVDEYKVVATTTMLQNMVKWGVSRVLGPKGLMPSSKVGTVTDNLKTCIENLRKGQAMYKNDKHGYVQLSIARLSFSAKQINDNLQALLEQIKPELIGFVKINATMLPSFRVK